MVYEGLYPLRLISEAKPGFGHADQASRAFRLTLGLYLPFGIDHPRATVGIVDFSASFAVRASPLANPENVGSTQQSRSTISVHWAAVLAWINFSAHALASW